MSDAAIIGAGLAGLVAAHAWPQLPVLEAAPAPAKAHRAVLRFRSEAVAQLTGIEFRRVRVRKGVWFRGAFREPTIQAANLYAVKVAGRAVGERSIWNLDPVDRYIAPPNFYEQLVVSVSPRISWGTPADFAGMRTPVISTAPLPLTLDAVGLQAGYAFERAAIRVRRYEVRGADVFQTIYFPSPETAMYRASITGALLIIESVVSDNYEDRPAVDLEVARRAFGIDDELITPVDDVEQRYGKIVELPPAERKRLLFELTHRRQIYSLGRFATWRNILLDDVVNDIAVIKRLMRSSPYALRIAAS